MKSCCALRASAFSSQRSSGATTAALGLFLAVRCASNVILSYLHNFAVHSIGRAAAYHYYFYVYWISFAVESILTLLVVYSVFRLAMAPLKGLQTLGMLVFKWAAGISVAVALGSAFAPNMNGTAYLIAAISQLQRTQSILTLCLLLFVCFAIRPMGLSYSSRIFGVSLGLGMLSTNDLVQSAWLTLDPKMSTHLQPHQRRRILRHPRHLDHLLRAAGAQAPHHRAAHYLALPALEPDLAGAGRQPRLRRRRRSTARALRAGRA